MTVNTPGNNVHGHCPHLGLKDDATTAFAFPSRWNHCYKAEPTAVPVLSYQRDTCLSDFGECPVFTRTKAAALPSGLREDVKKKHSKKLYLVGNLLLFVGVLAALFYFKALPFSQWELPFSTATIIPSALPSPTKTPAPPTATPLATLETKTPLPSVSMCAYPTDVSFGSQVQYSVHQVLAGENMSVIALHHESIPEVVQVVNPWLTIPLRGDEVIIVPVGAKSIEGLVPLQAVLLDESDLSVKDLADQLSVDVADLMAFNNLDANCSDFHGWVVIPVNE